MAAKKVLSFDQKAKCLIKSLALQDSDLRFGQKFLLIAGTIRVKGYENTYWSKAKLARRWQVSQGPLEQWPLTISGLFTLSLRGKLIIVLIIMLNVNTDV